MVQGRYGSPSVASAGAATQQKRLERRQSDVRTNIIDRALEDLKREFPRLDETAKGIVYSLFFLANHLSRTGGRVLEEIGLSWGEYLVLSTLRRRGPRGSMSPSAICESVNMSTGGVSNVLRRLEKHGHVKRSPSSRDGRGITVALTPKGRQLAEVALETISKNQLAQLDGLTPSGREDLYLALRDLVAQFEVRSTNGAGYFGT